MPAPESFFSIFGLGKKKDKGKITESTEEAPDVLATKAEVLEPKEAAEEISREEILNTALARSDLLLKDVEIYNRGTKKGMAMLERISALLDMIEKAKDGDSIAMEDLREGYFRAKAELSRKGDLLTARTPEGKEISVDLDSALGDSKSFFLRSGLSEFAKSLPESVDLSETALARCKEALEQGFDRVVFMPDLETINKVGITNLKAKLADTPLPDGTFSDEGDNYKNESYLEDPIAKKHFLTVSAEAKRAKGYLLFYSSESVPEETKNMTFPQAKKYLQEKGLNGLTLPEYYILQRVEAEQRKNHSFDTWDNVSSKSNLTWLVDSRAPEGVDSRAPGGCVRASWNPGSRQVIVSWNNAELRNPFLGARPAIVVPLL
jgi:hypothetical protein